MSKVWCVTPLSTNQHTSWRSSIKMGAAESGRAQDTRMRRHTNAKKKQGSNWRKRKGIKFKKHKYKEAIYKITPAETPNSLVASPEKLLLGRLFQAFCLNSQSRLDEKRGVDKHPKSSNLWIFPFCRSVALSFVPKGKPLSPRPGTRNPNPTLGHKPPMPARALIP